ncbi:MAG: hypothetical protein A2048_08710 [Deltaproteobacteria bacterium GWA2_45_12]|nr:MAG: hypothetical protein A2048_08710 [Deltaproteobacteria bacterium GWA2_45_12]
MNKHLLRMGFFLGMSGITTIQSAHAAWPVIDTTAIARMVQQINEMKKQYEVLKQQYAEMEATKDAVTGAYGVSEIANGEIDQTSRRALPGTWQEVVSQQKSGKLPGFFSERQDYYNKLFPSVDSKLFSESSTDRNAVSYQVSTQNTQASFSATEAIYNKIQDRLKTIETLTQEIDKTDNVKNATDLNSRIAAENGFLNVDMARLSALQLSLQASLQNGQNQATANHAEFFGKQMQ